MMDIIESPNYKKHTGVFRDYPCIICGKEVSVPRYFVHVHGGGGVVVTEAEAATMDSAADLGLYPIGADCFRRHPEYKPYIQGP